MLCLVMETSRYKMIIKGFPPAVNTSAVIGLPVSQYVIRIGSHNNKMLLLFEQ